MKSEEPWLQLDCGCRLSKPRLGYALLSPEPSPEPAARYLQLCPPSLLLLVCLGEMGG